jgi:hypothetical protein
MRDPMVPAPRIATFRICRDEDGVGGEAAGLDETAELGDEVELDENCASDEEAALDKEGGLTGIVQAPAGERPDRSEAY